MTDPSAAKASPDTETSGDAPVWEARLDRAKEITQQTLAWFPVRVWRHFLQNNGFLLAASLSYQSLFSMFALIYVAFVGVGLWLGDSMVEPLTNLINGYVPGLITEDPDTDGGLFSTAQVAALASPNTGVLWITGAVALGAAMWTATGFITFARRAVRDIFGLPPDLRNYVILKARDFVAALVFALLLVLGSALAFLGSQLLDVVFHVFGWSTESGWFSLGVKLASIAIGFLVFSAALGGLLRFLIGISLPPRMILPGATLGGGALTILQFGVGYLLGFTPSNPLLATFAVFIGLLLWFRLVGIILLVASSWVAVAAQDDGAQLIPLSDEEREEREHRAALDAAREQLRLAVQARHDAPWWRAGRMQREVQGALDALSRLEGVDPAVAKERPPTAGSRR
ncbi:MAG: YhjD/YihY/BrkB family envelope integrity protein [Microbacterium sp.]